MICLIVCAYLDFHKQEIIFYMYVIRHNRNFYILNVSYNFYLIYCNILLEHVFDSLRIA